MGCSMNAFVQKWQFQCEKCESYLTHRIHGAATYGNIYHPYTPNVSIYIYIPYMDPMGNNLELAVPQIYREISIYKQRWCRKPNPSTWSLANSWVYTVFWGLLKCIYHISLQNYRYTKYINIWANYNNSLTWIKAIWGWLPLLTMIPVRSQWGRYN